MGLVMNDGLDESDVSFDGLEWVRQRQMDRRPTLIYAINSVVFYRRRRQTYCETQSVTGEEDVGRSVQQRASNYETSATAAVFRRLHGRARN